MNDDLAIAGTLPALERQVFEAVTSLGTASVADVVAHLAAVDRPLAYTTVMTVLSRIFEKGYLLRQRAGKAYVYEARPAADIAHNLASKAARDAIDRYGDVALSGFIQTLTPEQRALLSQLLEGGEESGTKEDLVD